MTVSLEFLIVIPEQAGIYSASPLNVYPKKFHMFVIAVGQFIHVIDV